MLKTIPTIRLKLCWILGKCSKMVLRLTSTVCTVVLRVPKRLFGKSLRGAVIHPYTKVYACATMWHETAHEMMEMLKSFMKLDLEILNQKKGAIQNFPEFEFHVFLDEAYIWCTEIGEVDGQKKEIRIKRVNNYVQVFLSSKMLALNIVYDKTCTSSIETPELSPTPYGGKIHWKLPGGTPLVLHLKDTMKVRRKKRWSQIMYIRYITEFSKPRDDQNIFILALDGDTNFDSLAVIRAYDIIMADKTIGVVCGRVHPVGKGALVWYQKFEYAISHWLQKATEDVYGGVLCSPGCFSFFRASCLRMVLQDYESDAKEAKDYLKFDQGEDRWLTTLVMRQGYRVKYSANSVVYTQAPESYDELFKQRRRWEPSTLVNNMDILFKETDILRKRTYLWITYISLIIFSIFMAPSNIFLVITHMTYSVLQIPWIVSLYINLTLVMAFVVTCFRAKNHQQIRFAKMLSCAYALLTSIFIIQKTIEFQFQLQFRFLLPIIVLQLLFLGILHPNDFTSLLYAVPYFVLVPTMQFLVQIYSAINLNNVSWGTREDTSDTNSFLKDNGPSDYELITSEDYWTRQAPFKEATFTELPADELRFWENLLFKSLTPMVLNSEQKLERERCLIKYRNSVVLFLGVVSFSYILSRQLGMYISLPYSKEFNVPFFWTDSADEDTFYVKWQIVDLIVVIVFILITSMQNLGLLVHRCRSLLLLIQERNRYALEPVLSLHV